MLTDFFGFKLGISPMSKSHSFVGRPCFRKLPCLLYIYPVSTIRQVDESLRDVFCIGDLNRCNTGAYKERKVWLVSCK